MSEKQEQELRKVIRRLAKEVVSLSGKVAKLETEIAETQKAGDRMIDMMSKVNTDILMPMVERSDRTIDSIKGLEERITVLEKRF